MIDIHIRHYGLSDSEEAKAGELLKKKFESLCDATGCVYIYTGVTIPGGEKVKDVDIVVMGQMNGYSVEADCLVYDVAQRAKTTTPDTHNIFIKSFCFTIELKDHEFDKVRVDEMSQVLVKYNDTEEYHPATGQSQDQKNSLIGFFKKKYKGQKCPFVRNFVWLRQIDHSRSSDLFQDDNNLALVGDFPLDEMFRKGIVNLQQSLPRRENGICVLRDFQSNDTQWNTILGTFEHLKATAGNITRGKMELLSRRALESVDIKFDKFSIHEGRAGTGKTVQLLQSAYKLAYEEEKRCLILTYNHALASDINRLIAYSGMPDDIDGQTVQVKTLGSFFYSLFVRYGILQQGDSFVNYDTEYPKAVSDLKNLVQENPLNTDWDFVFIDEAQDWSEDEKLVLFSLFDKSKICVADGVDQFMRSSSRLNWKAGMADGEFSRVSYKIGLRQKYNIVSFVKKLAEDKGVRWDVEPNDSLVGGKVIVTDSITPSLLKNYIDSTVDAGNSGYDVLMLVPNTLVNYNGTPGYCWASKLRKSIPLYDGTLPENRMGGKYPINNDSIRVFQYESCRGIEGWTVICSCFNALFKLKYEEFRNHSVNENMPLVTYELKALQWCLMPLTRAMDTLVIHLDTQDSDPISQSMISMLRRISAQMPDIVEWQCNQ